MKNKFFIILFSIILTACILVIILSKNINQDSKFANIYQEGKLVNTIDLNSVVNEYDIKVSENIVHVEHGKISMSSASCPDKLCVKQGKIENGVYPIVCLPNKIVIEIKNEKTTTEIDAISGRN
ncbi:MAG: NusG domain II-containing protein [Oscillospiraceae bacterium]